VDAEGTSIYLKRLDNAIPGAYNYATGKLRAVIGSGLSTKEYAERVTAGTIAAARTPQAGAHQPGSAPPGVADIGEGSQGFLAALISCPGSMDRLTEAHDPRSPSRILSDVTRP
jgi:hypothetical protein